MPLVLGAAENAALFRLNLVQQQVWCKINSYYFCLNLIVFHKDLLL